MDLWVQKKSRKFKNNLDILQVLYTCVLYIIFKFFNELSLKF